jgi:hypothetical protein
MRHTSDHAAKKERVFEIRAKNLFFLLPSQPVNNLPVVRLECCRAQWSGGHEKRTEISAKIVKKTKIFVFKKRGFQQKS